MPRVLPQLRPWLSAARRAVALTFDELFPPIVPQAVREAEAAGFHIDVPAAYCARCGASTGPGEATTRGCSHCVGQPIAWDRIVRLSLYTQPVSDWIIAMKFHKEWGWATWFGQRLAEAVMPVAEAEKTVVCHVPMPWIRRWRRGYSQAQLIARAFARRAGLREADILRRRGWQAPQMSMLRSQREQNVRHAFAIDAVDLTGWRVWLIDDVKTSGASLTPCVHLLRQAGAERVDVAVAAVADPRQADFKVK